jgi:hypothetical protein
MKAVIRLALLLAVGCTGPSAKMAQVSGKVTFKGKPVPAGYVSFMPDGTKGNLGEIRVAQIKDGEYNTAMEVKPGIPAGAHVISIAGFDGHRQKFFWQGKQIFNPYELRETVAEGASTMDFTVPPSAGENLKIVPTADD